MHRLVIAALLASASGMTAASAQSLPPTPSYFASSDAALASPERSPPPVRTAAYRGEMGGGFIEFVFGDPRRPAPPSPRARFDPSMPVEEAPPPMQPQAVMPPASYAPSPGYAPQGYAQPPGVAGVPRGPDPRYLRQEVAYGGSEKPGTIVIDTPSKYLFLVQPGGRAIRYGIGVGRPGFTWAGVKTVSQKREWPDWRPPDEMLARRPDLPRYMAGGPDNPLGARALYLGSTLYRIHGSNEPWTIGQQVSSGCIRMRNEDVIDLYERVGLGTKVIVI
jgi:lipoprotein-anchoring transpeptidase ErfK/SrfK